MGQARLRPQGVDPRVATSHRRHVQQLVRVRLRRGGVRERVAVLGLFVVGWRRRGWLRVSDFKMGVAVIAAVTFAIVVILWTWAIIGDHETTRLTECLRSREHECACLSIKGRDQTKPCYDAKREESQ